MQRPQTLCDVHFAEGKEIDAKTIAVTVQGFRREIDLCADHEAELVTPLYRVLVDHGRGSKGESTRQPTKKRAERVPPSQEHKCSDCGRVFDRVQSLAVHRSRIHGIKGSTPTAIKARKETAKRRRQKAKAKA